MNKAEREKLREECNRLGTIYGDSVSHLSIRDTKVLLDHIDALEGQTDDEGFVTIPVRAIWLLGNKPEGYLDHGCGDCMPNGPMVHGSFICAYHRAETALASAPEVK